MTVEEFLKSLPTVRILGGSPLYEGMPYQAISLNGRRHGAYAAAINTSKADILRVCSWRYVLVPRPQGASFIENAMLPEKEYKLPESMPNVQPTTCLSLLLICRELDLKVELYGVCGWASKWHDGDWEMHYIKTKMPNVTVHDPRPKW